MPFRIERVKKQILVVENNAEIKNVIVMHVESEFNVSILYAEGVIQAIEQIKSKDPVLIICKYDLPDRKGSDLYHYLKIRKLDIPLMLITEKYVADDEKLRGYLTSNKFNSYFRFPIREDEFVQKISKVINLSRPSEVERFRRIRGKSCTMFKNERLPVFLQDNEDKYVEVTDFSSLENNPDSFAFVRLDDYKAMSEKINKSIIYKLSNSKTAPSEKFSLQFESVRKIHASLAELGMSEEEIKLGRAVYDSSIEILKKNIRMAKLVGTLVKYDNYIYRLSMMCNYLSVAMVTRTKWYSEHSMKKLSLASLFQDLGLIDDDLAKITDIESESYHKLPDVSKRKVINHPFQSVKLLKEVKDVEDICNNIENIVMFHHVRPYGGGFPDKSHIQNMCELARIYIIAHEFAHRLLEKKLTMEVLEQILIDFEKHFSTGKFRFAYHAFKEVFKRKKSILSRYDAA